MTTIIESCYSEVDYHNLHSLIKWYEFMSPVEKYESTIDFYTNTEMKSGFLKKLVISCKKDKPASVDLQLQSMVDEFGDLKIYTASTKKSKQGIINQLSWTLDKVIADKFKVRKQLIEGKSAFIYSAVINVKDVIAYTNNRREQEIIQHGNVKQLKIIN